MLQMSTGLDNRCFTYIDRFTTLQSRVREAFYDTLIMAV